MGAMSLHCYAWGFLEMAEMAADRLIANTCSIDNVVPATLYAFRHSVELFVKGVLYELKVVDESKPVPGHFVDGLLAKHREMLKLAIEHEPRWRGDRNDWVGRLEELVAAIAELDQDGQSTRYPADKKLVPNQNGRFVISTKNLRDCLRLTRTIYSEIQNRDT